MLENTPFISCLPFLLLHPLTVLPEITTKINCMYIFLSQGRLLEKLKWRQRVKKGGSMKENTGGGGAALLEGRTQGSICRMWLLIVSCSWRFSVRQERKVLEYYWILTHWKVLWLLGWVELLLEVLFAPFFFSIYICPTYICPIYI